MFLLLRGISQNRIAKCPTNIFKCSSTYSSRVHRLKPQWATTAHLPEKVRWKRQMISNAGKDVEQSELSYITDGSVLFGNTY